MRSTALQQLTECRRGQVSEVSESVSRRRGSRPFHWQLLRLPVTVQSHPLARQALSDHWSRLPLVHQISQVPVLLPRTARKDDYQYRKFSGVGMTTVQLSWWFRQPVRLSNSGDVFAPIRAHCCNSAMALCAFSLADKQAQAVWSAPAWAHRRRSPKDSAN